MSAMNFYSYFTLLVTGLCLVILFHRKIRSSPIWHATIIPLASIIGSGFLVSAPLLFFTTGKWATLVMLIIVVLAYAIGSGLRFNIRYLEPLLKQKKSLSPWLAQLEKLSYPVLGAAYIISVAFYLKLLSAFVVQGMKISSPMLENILTTVILLVIGVAGYLRGLTTLRIFEIYSVNTKLAIIIALITSQLVFNIELFIQDQWFLTLHPTESLDSVVRKLLGVILIIQGFETSRFIGQAYSPATRIQTMRYAQIISGVIYVTFIATAMAIFTQVGTLSETAIIDMSRVIAPVLPVLLIIAAVMSQFSAAVADTIGSGGLLAELSRQKLSVSISYLVITLISLLLIWVTNIYEIIVIASKAFAIYYAIQLLIAYVLVRKQPNVRYPRLKKLLFGALFILMLLVVIFGIPVKS